MDGAEYNDVQDESQRFLNPPVVFRAYERTAFSFFFSSRRRHTRLQGDWSSDVCSSDLSPYMFGFPGAVVKSSISLFKRNPAPATVTALPKPPFKVVVTAAALPSASTME